MSRDQQQATLVKIKQSAVRQRWRGAALLSSLLLFPITLFHLSFYLPVAGAAEGLVNGSLLVGDLLPGHRDQDAIGL